jgi:hypothetical protein
MNWTERELSALSTKSCYIDFAFTSARKRIRHELIDGTSINVPFLQSRTQFQLELVIKTKAWQSQPVVFHLLNQQFFVIRKKSTKSNQQWNQLDEIRDGHFLSHNERIGHFETRFGCQSSSNRARIWEGNRPPVARPDRFTGCWPMFIIVWWIPHEAFQTVVVKYQWILLCYNLTESAQYSFKFPLHYHNEPRWGRAADDRCHFLLPGVSSLLKSCSIDHWNRTK